MPKAYKPKTTGGGPDFHQPLFGSGTYVTASDEEYRIAQLINPTTALFGGGEGLVPEGSWGT